MQSQRIVFGDYLRVIACFMVMLVHSSEKFYAADSSGLPECFNVGNEATGFGWPL